MVLAQHFMVAPFPTVGRGASVGEATRALLTAPGSTSVAVVEEGVLVGTVSAVDLARRSDGGIGDLTHPPPGHLVPGAPLLEVRARFCEGGFCDVPIVSDRRFVGMVTARSLLRGMFSAEPGARPAVASANLPTSPVRPVRSLTNQELFGAERSMSEFREPDAEAVSGPSPPPLASPHPSEGVAPPRVSAPADVAPVAAHRATVLVVDDDELMRQLQVMIVEDIGLLAIQAGSASEARLQIERHGDHIGLVLLDVHLPDGSGVQLCEAITGGEWEPMRSVPIVIVTADREEALVEDAFFAGSVRQFHKPFEPEQLQHVVRAHMNLT